MKPGVSLGTAALLLAAGVLLFGHAALAQTTAHRAHYLVFELDENGFSELLDHRIVGLDQPLEPLPDEDWLAARVSGGLGRDALSIELADGGGAVVHRDLVPLQVVLRGEFHGERQRDGTAAIERHVLPVTRRFFVARVPIVDGGRLTIEGERREVFALDAALLDRRRPRAGTREPSAVRRLSRSGSPANRVDLLIMGDGYRQGEADRFAADAQALADEFLSITPYAEYRNFVNVTALFTPSSQAGADHPPYRSSCTGDDPSCCADAAAQDDPSAGSYVDTAFDGRFCAFNIHRLAVVDLGKVFAEAAAVPEWDQILVMIHDETYGGSGGSIAVVSTHPLAVEIARHEYGHTFTGLADEYDTPFPGFPTCSDLPGSPSPCEPNVTDETERPLIKWEPWIAAATPVPTPEGPGTYQNKVGLFEGARYQSSDLYRPRDQCLMGVFGVPFGQICRQAYVLELYSGGWGQPAGGIDAIEPGSERPPPGNIASAGPVELGVDLLQPIGAPPLAVTWKIDGATVPGASSSSLRFAPAAPGTYRIDLEVEDTTPLVHRQMAGRALRSSRRWNVTVSSGPSECTPGATTLCLDDERFQVEVRWRDFFGNTGDGQVVPFGSSDSGLWWFFDPDNWEMLVKVLDGCAITGHYWVFAAATTNIEYTLTVTDTASGTVADYFNPLGNAAAAITDTSALATCSASPPASPPRAPRHVRLDRPTDGLQVWPRREPGSVAGAARATCTAGPTAMCLNDQRFRVEVRWRDFFGNSGAGQVVPFGSNDSGLWWFFDPDNWEMLVKVLDGCALTSHYWVFAAATTNVEYTLTVTDTSTGETVDYFNPLGHAAAAITDTGALATCP